MLRWLLKSLAIILLTAACFAPGISLLAQQPAPKRTEQPKEETVYVTRTGKRYHRENCSYLDRRKFPILLKKAKKLGYTPCRVCRPPQ